MKRIANLAQAVDDVAGGRYPETALVYLGFLRDLVDEAMAAALPDRQ